MIKNWQHFDLHPDFQNIKCSVGKPSDVDMFYMTKDKFLIIGEFKNADMGKLGTKQKEMFETFIDDYKNGGIVIYATHHKTIEQGATEYDASQCQVEQYYYKGNWHTPKKYTIVQDIINNFDKEKSMNIQCYREKTIFRFEKDGKIFYSIGLSRKDKEGNYENGYISVRFPKSADIPNKSKIKIIQGWLDFYLKDKITNPYIFINKYELVEQKEEIPQNIKTAYDDTNIKIEDTDLPF